MGDLAERNGKVFSEVDRSEELLELMRFRARVVTFLFPVSCFCFHFLRNRDVW